MAREQKAQLGVATGAAMYFAIMALLFVFVFATGSTFGQRCKRAFPDDPARAELCVYNLSNGNPP